MILRKWQQPLVLWLLSAGLLACTAAGNPARGRALRVKRWTTEDGLPQNRIACLHQTRDGYLWIGTWFGLARFDGVRFTIFNRYNTPALVSDTINALAESDDGTFWIGTKDGLVSYRDCQFRRLTLAEGLPSSIVSRILPSASGGVWLHSGPFVTRLNQGTFSRAVKVEHEALNGIRTLRETPEGDLEIFLERAWLLLSPSGALRTNYQVWPPEHSWEAVLSGNRPGALQVATQEGLYDIEPGTTPCLHKDNLAGSHVDLLCRGRQGRLWANVRSQSGGLYGWEGTNWAKVELGTEFSGANVVCMEEDQEGQVWLGTAEGLIRLQWPCVRTYTLQDGLADNQVWSVCESAEGNVWVGTDRGVSVLSEGQMTVIQDGQPRMRAPVFCVWPNREGGVWFFREHFGLFQCRKDKPELVLPSTKVPGLVRALYETQSGQLWVGSSGGALALVSDKTEAPGVQGVGPDLKEVHCVLKDHEGDIWFGTKGQGICRLHGDHKTRFTEKDGLGSNDVWCFHEDSTGALWIGTENGLTRFSHGKFVTFSPGQGLPDKTVYCVLEDESGYLWLSSLHGLHAIRRAELDAVADGRQTTFQCFTLGTADGMESAESNGENQPAGWKDRAGRLWFPTARGLVVVDPKEVPLHELPPRVLLEKTSVDDQVVFGNEPAAQNPRLAEHRRYPDEAKLSAGRARVVEFRYTATALGAPERTRFRYRLVGADEDWRQETQERTAHYINLRPGHYRFEVVAANQHNIWSTQPAMFAFSVAPFFWQTSTFYLLCGGAVIGLAAAIQGYRLHWQRRLLKIEEQRTIANERARIARDLHDDLGTALTGLALELHVAARGANGSTSLANRLEEAANRTRGLAERMREVVWMVNPNCDTLSSLADFLEQGVSQFLRTDDFRVHLDFPEDIPPLAISAEARHHLALNVREALTNVVRHACATEVTLSLALATGRLVVTLSDNGRGFEPQVTQGHGLANMRERMQQAGGEFECHSTPGAGTRLVFCLPLADDPPAGE